jgi:hypothetical protein
VRLFAGRDYSSNHALVDYRVKQLVYACIQAVHQNRFAAFIYFFCNKKLVLKLSQFAEDADP